MSETIQTSLFEYFMEDERFTTKQAYDLIENIEIKVNKESIRARIYEGIEKGIFEKLDKGVYRVIKKIDDQDVSCLLINGDGRDLSMVKDNSVDAIITDHPYELTSSLTGGNRNFANYDLFKYNINDFREKQRVLKEGAFLVEFLPNESEQNFDYLYEIKKMAQEAGFKYYAKVPWVKGEFVANTGRCAKNSEDIMFFTKGEPRTLKLDAKKNLAEARTNGLNVEGLSSYEIKKTLSDNNLPVHYMKGTNGMLPTCLNHAPKAVKDKVCQAEKPVELIEEIIDYITLPDEVVLDQFAGSHNVALAGINTDRKVITFEKDKNMFDKALDYISNNLVSNYVMEG